MSDTAIFIPGLVFTQPEVATTAVPVLLTAGSLALQSQTNYALITFPSAHGYTATLNANGTTTYANATTGHGATAAGLTYFQFAGLTVNTQPNGITLAIAGIPSTTTMLVWLTLTGTNPTITGATFVPVFIPTLGTLNLTLGANCTVQYNPDNTGYPQVAPNATIIAPVFRTIEAVSTSAQISFDGVGQTIIVASGSAGTSRWSLYAH